VNPAFKHLEAKLKIGDLTIRQWAGIALGAVMGLLYADFLHPFSTTLTLASAVYIGGIPIAVAIVGGMSEFDAWLVLRSALRWRRSDDRFLPGAGEPTCGYYVLLNDEFDFSAMDSLTRLDPAGLWGERS
jgi:hypothetical protein